MRTRLMILATVLCATIASAQVTVTPAPGVSGSGLVNGDYLSFGATPGATGYGVRTNAGKIEFKDLAGAWTALDFWDEASYYVEVDGNDTTGTGTVSRPFATIQHAIDVLLLAGGTPTSAYVKVGPGTYTENLSITSAVNIAGVSSSATLVYGTLTMSAATGSTYIRNLTLYGADVHAYVQTGAGAATFYQAAIVTDWTNAVSGAQTTSTAKASAKISAGALSIENSWVIARSVGDSVTGHNTAGLWVAGTAAVDVDFDKSKTTVESTGAKQISSVLFATNTNVSTLVEYTFNDAVIEGVQGDDSQVWLVHAHVYAGSMRCPNNFTELETADAGGIFYADGGSSILQSSNSGVPFVDVTTPHLAQETGGTDVVKVIHNAIGSMALPSVTGHVSYSVSLSTGETFQSADATVVNSVVTGTLAVTGIPTFTENHINIGGVAYQWPATSGTNAQVLSTNGAAGVLSWADQTGSGGTGLTTLNGLGAATQSFANDTNITIASNTATHTLTWAGSLATTRGGTGQTAYTAGDLLYYASGAALSKLTLGATNDVLVANGTAPLWSHHPTFADLALEVSMRVGAAATYDGLLVAPVAKGAGQFDGTLTSADLTAARTWTLPNVTGIFALTVDKLSAFAATTSAELLGVISDETGTGRAVFGTAPVFTTSLTAGLLASQDVVAIVPNDSATRFTGTVTPADLTADHTWTMPNLTGTVMVDGLAYGSTTVADGAVSVTVGATSTAITQFTTAVSVGMTWDAGANVATIVQAGLYDVSFHLSYTGTNARRYICSVYGGAAGTTELLAVHASSTWITNEATENIDARGLLTLAASDVMSVKCHGSNANDVMVVQDGQFLLVRIR